jgi:hypothetical protein
MEPEFVRFVAWGRTAFRHGVGLGLGVAAGVAVGAGVGVGEGVAVGTGVGVGVGTGVGVGVGTGVGVAVGTGVGVAVGTGVGVAVGAGVGVAVGAGVGLGVPRPGVGVAVGAGVGVAVGAGVGVAVGAGVAQSVTTTFRAVVSPFASRSVIVVEPTATATTSNHEARLPLTRGVLRLRAASTATVAMRGFADEAAMSIAPSSLTPSTTPIVPLHSVSV